MKHIHINLTNVQQTTLNKNMYKSLLITTVLFFVLSCNTNSEKKKNDISIQQEGKVPQTELQKSLEQGKSVYKDFCIQCHMANGKGIPNNFPPLAGSNWLTEKRKESIHVVKYGQKGEIEVKGIKYDGIMTPMGLSAEEVADVLNYIMNSWGNTQSSMVTEAEVSSVEK